LHDFSSGELGFFGAQDFNDCGKVST